MTRPTCSKCGEVLLLPTGPFGPNYSSEHDDGCMRTCEWCGHDITQHGDWPYQCWVTDCGCRYQ